MRNEKIKNIIHSSFGRYINIPLLSHLFLRPVKPNIKTLNDVYSEYKIFDKKTKSCDLGCGFEPSNGFNADEIYGIDLYEKPDSKIFKCRMGFEKLPFADGSMDYLIASNILEHIPRISSKSNSDHYPFIYLMNECHRILAPGGRFLSITPMYPFPAAFQDPTHVNFITSSTFDLYFSKNKLPIASHYGVTTDFDIIYKATFGQALVAIMTKY